MSRDWVHVLVMPDYKPGDLPPEGYLQWHEWAEVQRKAGIKQRQCPTCGLWRTPQELSTRQIEWTVKDRNGHAIMRSDFECAKCEAKRAT
jgi:hypothetical protein